MQIVCAKNNGVAGQRCCSKKEQNKSIMVGPNVFGKEPNINCSRLSRAIEFWFYFNFNYFFLKIRQLIVSFN